MLNQNYYLHRIDGANNTPKTPLYVTAGNDLREYVTADFNTLIGNALKYTAGNSADGYKINYSYGKISNKIPYKSAKKQLFTRSGILY